jgi:hypothetical protein
MQRVAQLHTLKADWDHRQSISAGLHALVKKPAAPHSLAPRKLPVVMGWPR